MPRPCSFPSPGAGLLSVLSPGLPHPHIFLVPLPVLVGLQGQLGRGTEARSLRSTGSFAQHPFRVLRSTLPDGNPGQGCCVRQTVAQCVPMFAQPLVKLGIGWFRAKGDLDRPNGRIDALLQNTDPELAVEVHSECCFHVISRYAKADLVTLDSPVWERRAPTGAARTSYRAVRFAHQD